MAKGQYGLAEQFGYVESMGGDGFRRGDLVPYDHPTSPLSTEDIEGLMKLRNAPGFIGGIKTSKAVRKSATTKRKEFDALGDAVTHLPKRSAHQCQVCPKCGVSIRSGKRFEKHYATCRGL